MRGPVLTFEGDAGFVMLASPWIAEPDDIERLGLTLGDFAVHDQTMDLLQVVQTHRMSIDDLRKLNAKLTEQRASLRDQRTEARKLALVAARTNDAVVVTDVQGRIEWTNEGFTRITGWTLEEVVGRKPGGFLQGPETDPATVDTIRSHIGRHKGVSVEILNYSKTGRKYWLAIEIQPMHDESGALIGFMAVERDITDARETDRKLREIAALRQAMLNDAGSAIIATDPEGIITLFNPAAERMLGFHAEELIGVSTPAVFHDHAEVVTRAAELTAKFGTHVTPGFEAFVAKARRGELDQREWTYVRKDETRLPVLLSVTALTDEDRLIGFLGIATDLSEQKDAEAKIQTTLSELDTSHEKLILERDRANKLTKEAEAANRAKSDFLATMSHEIRTPMNGVLGFAQLLQQTTLSEQQDDFVASIRSSAEALLRVINDVLDFSKIESGHMSIERHPFSLQPCVDEALETVSTAAAEKQIDLAALLTPAVPHSVVGDPYRLRQILVNLLGNAVKFTPEGEVRLEVDASPREDGRTELTFRVTDTGIGIRAGDLDELFKPFHQEDSSTSRRFGGTGLGLAICRRLVELMDGSIRVTSTPDEGSQFTFSIPVSRSDEPPALVHPMPFPGLDGQRVLVIDSHPWSRRVICELLERWGMEIRSASSLADAASPDGGWSPNFALVDLASVDSSKGKNFIRVLTKAGVTVLVICPPSETVTQRKRFGDSIHGTIAKPIRVSLLFNTLLARTCGRAGPNPATATVPRADAGHSNLKVLLAEDNPLNRKLALTVMDQLGCRPDVATDGREAVEAATRERYDIILMDIQMPDMDGLEATRRIRQWEKEHDTVPARIIALTANALAGDRDICLQAGMDDYLPKPLRLEALRGMIRKIATGPAEEASPGPTPREDSASARALRILAAELSPDDAATLAGDFLEDLDGQVGEVREAIRLRNFKDARRHAHSLKGSCAIFSLDVLSEAAHAVEQACLGERPEAPEALLPGLAEAAIESARTLREALAALGDNPAFDPMS